MLASSWMMKSFHHEELAVNSVMGLIEQGRRHRHLGVCQDRIPAGLLVLKPAPHPFTIDCPCHAGDMIGKVAEPLPQESREMLGVTSKLR